MMTSVPWPLLIVAVLFLIVGLYFFFGRDSVVLGAKTRREQANRIRPANRQLPESMVTAGRAAGGGIALAVVGFLLLVVFLIDLFR
jgi:hypothetical protein